jgi:predicted SnoaL-like aldol condensation-catalyzing enzyme
MQRSSEIEQTNKANATRFIQAFNTDDWDTVREVVASNYVFHHPVGGTVQAGQEGMVSAWSGFKTSLPDSWHPIVTTLQYCFLHMATLLGSRIMAFHQQENGWNTVW